MMLPWYDAAAYGALASVIALTVGAGILGPLSDYFEYKNGNIGWNLLPAPVKSVWRWRHPDEPIVEYRERSGYG